eukprot:scaffold65029_cov32-Tisochrysis_lutea.AAC.1
MSRRRRRLSRSSCKSGPCASFAVGTTAPKSAARVPARAAPPSPRDVTSVRAGRIASLNPVTKVDGRSAVSASRSPQLSSPAFLSSSSISLAPSSTPTPSAAAAAMSSAASAAASEPPI